MVQTENILELIRKASTDLSFDVESILLDSKSHETKGSVAENVFTAILENVALARKKSTPICQDTGALIFYIDYPVGGNELVYQNAIFQAVQQATELHYLRPNAVNPISAKNSGTNLGINAPTMHFQQWENPETRVRLLLKGGGSENVSTQYKLPDLALNAGRDLKGVRKVIIDAVVKAQGLGCAPGFIGVGIGGSRDTSFALAKEQFFRKIGQRHGDDSIADLEKQLIAELNQLNIGPMGLGGKTTVLDVFIDYQHRHPATYFVAVSYNCWAYRRKSMIIRKNEVAYD